ncbi:MAG: putative dehydrogenase [Phormidesmis priestleyi Ana]|uniref:Putative dehydrogenase n=1 Tax=Phormidesmis priestleyi Ana TaxID=1666911 RepID=A0A0N8KNL5_9CYAN|nr:MAG: putative dehydrogenase [Phormidesmis priestleyi Ana]
MAQIGVAVVGTGFGQKVHIPGLQAHHRTEVVAVWNRDRTKAQSVADSCGASLASHSLSEILDQDTVHAVTLATPPFAHYDMARQILQAKKHLLLEKPVTLSVDEAKHLQQLAADNNVVIVPDFEFRYIPAWQYFAQLLSEGVVGHKRLIKIDWLASSRANPQRAWDWYAQKALGGGALGSIGSHTFDYVNWLFGPAADISATLSTSIAERPDPETGEMKPVDSDDVCAIALTLADKTLCQITLSAVSYAGRGHWIEVYGDKGTLVIGNPSQTDYVNGFKVYFSEPGAEPKEMPVPKAFDFPKVYLDGRIAPFVRVIDHWVSCIDAGKERSPGMREGVYSQLLMDLTHQAHTLGQRLSIPTL